MSSRFESEKEDAVEAQKVSPDGKVIELLSFFESIYFGAGRQSRTREDSDTFAAVLAPRGPVALLAGGSDGAV